MYGADVHELEELAKRMAAGAEQLEHIRAIIRSGLYTVRWGGPDAEQIRRHWEATSGPALVSTAHELKAVGERLRLNARQQQQASAADGGIGTAAWAAAAAAARRMGSIGVGVGLMSPVVLAGLVAKGVDDYVVKELEALVDAGELPTRWTLADASRAKLSGGSAVFGGLALASFLAGQIFPGQRTIAQGFEHGFEVGSAGLKLTEAIISKGALVEHAGVLGRVGPALGVISGTLGLVQDFGEAGKDGWTGTHLASAAGHGLVTLGSAAMLIPVPGAPQVVGAGLVAAGTVIGGGVWAYEHREEIKSYLDAGTHAVASGLGTAAHAAVQVNHAVESVGRDLGHATTSTWNTLKGLL